ncbi:MAG: hypothetical protein K1W28_09180 [Lachnospiraceae bacterium]
MGAFIDKGNLTERADAERSAAGGCVSGEAVCDADSGTKGVRSLSGSGEQGMLPAHGLPACLVRGCKSRKLNPESVRSDVRSGGRIPRGTDGDTFRCP